MTNREAAKKLFELTEENAKLKAAMNVLKYFTDKAKAEERSYALEVGEAEAILNVTGMIDKDIEGITFDNCEDVAYES